MKRKKRLKKEVILLGFLFLTLILLIILMVPKEIYFNDFNKNKQVALYTNFDSSDITACYGSKFFSDMANCHDVSDQIKVIGKVDTNKVGNYVLVYSLDYQGVKKTFSQKISVIDDEKPVIDFLGNNTVVKCPNGNIYEPEFNVIDNQAIEIINNTKRYEKDDKYIYEATDTYGNVTVAERQIIFADNIKPSIELIGGSEISIPLNQEFIDPGFKVYDNCDENINMNVQTEGVVNTSTEGLYIIRYFVEDESKNYESITRKIIVGNPILINSGKIVYLTFDDGPSINTEKLLDVLKKYNIQATFFVTGQFSDYSNVISRMANEGHAVGLHTYSHVFKKIYSSEENYFEDINKLNELIKSHTGNYSNILRFAGGSSNTTSYFNRGIMSKLAKSVTEKGITYFDWNVDSMDTKYKDPIKIANSVISGLKQNKSHYIVLQHDTKNSTSRATELIIEFGLKNGYIFKPLTSTSPIVHHSINN